MKKLLTLMVLSLTISHLYGQGEENADTTQTTIIKVYQDIEAFKRLKVSGYIQAQFQYADSSGQASFNGGNFPSGTDKRFALRRGRVKFQYDGLSNERGISTSQYVLQFDVTEKGLTIKDAFVKITDPWIGWFSLTAGMQNRPFGYEIPYSSSQRESPERGRMSQILFPGERDLGAMITVQGSKSSQWNWLKLEAGMFNGTGGPGALRDASDFDKFKDFIAHLSMSKSAPSEKMKYGLGLSYYYGGFRVDTVNVYDIGNDTTATGGFVLKNKKSDFYAVPIGSRMEAMRKYIGVDGQFSFDWSPGITTLRAEYIQGEQPGFSSTSAPWNATASPSAVNTSDIYLRNFNGAYFYFLQNIVQTPLQLIVKYDWYDPNTDVAGDEIGKKVGADNSGNALKAFNASDIRYETWGLGLAYRWDSNVKITAYYDMVKNETSQNLSGYTGDLNDDVVTVRVQVRF